jgi:hypothetical protein
LSNRSSVGWPVFTFEFLNICEYITSGLLQFPGRRTDVYVETLYQKVNGGGGNPVFNASIFNVTPSANDRQLLLVAGVRHRF